MSTCLRCQPVGLVSRVSSTAGSIGGGHGRTDGLVPPTAPLVGGGGKPVDFDGVGTCGGLETWQPFGPSPCSLALVTTQDRAEGRRQSQLLLHGRPGMGLNEVNREQQYLGHKGSRTDCGNG